MIDIRILKKGKVRLMAQTEKGKDFLMMFQEVQVDAFDGMWIERNPESLQDIVEEARSKGVIIE